MTSRDVDAPPNIAPPPTPDPVPPRPANRRRGAVAPWPRRPMLETLWPRSLQERFESQTLREAGEGQRTQHASIRHEDARRKLAVPLFCRSLHEP